MIDVTPENVARMLEGVTEGPWAYEAHGDTGTYGIGLCFGEDDSDCEAPLSGEADSSANVAEVAASTVEGFPNARFIAYAREAVPALAAELATVLSREAETQQRHDARVGKLEADLTAALARAEKADAELAKWKAAPTGAMSDDVRRWQHYPIEMPVTADGQGPAIIGVNAARITYEVWDQLFVSHGSFDNLPDAINEAMRLNGTSDRAAMQAAVEAFKKIIEVDDAGDMMYRADGPAAKIARAALDALKGVE